MTGKAKTPSKKPSEPESPCGSSCPDFAEKICPGEDSGCAIYWRFTQDLK